MLFRVFSQTYQGKENWMVLVFGWLVGCFFSPPVSHKIQIFCDCVRPGMTTTVLGDGEGLAQD